MDVNGMKKLTFIFLRINFTLGVRHSYLVCIVIRKTPMATPCLSVRTSSRPSKTPFTSLYVLQFLNAALHFTKCNIVTPGSGG